MPGLGRAIKRLARFATRKWPEPIYELRRELGLPRGANPLFDAKHSPNLVLALFSRVLGVEQKDWPANTLITGFCFYDSDAGNAALPAHLEKFVAAGRGAGGVYAGIGGGAGGGRFLRTIGAGGACRLGVRAVLLIGTDPRNRPQQATAGFDLRGGVCAVFGAVSAARAWWCTRAAWERRRSACARASRC